MAQFIPASPFVAKLGIVAEVLDGDEVRLRMPLDPTNVTLGDMVHGGAIAALADMTVMAAAWAGAEAPTRCAASPRRCRCNSSRRPRRPISSASGGCCGAARRWSIATSTSSRRTVRRREGDRHLQSGLTWSSRSSARGALTRVSAVAEIRTFDLSPAEGSVVGCDDGASLDLAVVQELIGVRRIVEREVFDEHLDLAGLGQANHVDQLGDRTPER